MRCPKIHLAFLLLGLLSVPAADAAPRNVRLYPGLAAYVNNPQGQAFELELDVRDWNVFADGPRELLLKVYDPQGRALVREIIEDDGITNGAYLPRIAGWDHEMWYYAMCYGRGSMPMMRWSSWSEPDRLAALKARTFRYTISGGERGIYRILITGARDHTVTLRLAPDLPYALAGHPIWLHGRGAEMRRTYVYMPKGTTGLHLGFAEYDQPLTRQFTVRAPDGAVLFDGEAKGGFQEASAKFETEGRYDDKLLTVEVSDGAGDYMLHVQLLRGRRGAPALFAWDQEMARALRGGAIYHDGEVFWHAYQVRFHDWLKTLKPEEFVVRDKDGNEIKPAPSKRAYGWGHRGVEYPGLPSREGFVPMNGPHEAPPVCDVLMHSYPAHTQRGVLNLALKDLAEGLRIIGPGDTPLPIRWHGNMGYLFGSYNFHYWRPAWRILRQSDAPQEVKDLVQEAMLLCGDRLAFCRTIERVNGNAFAHIPHALRYCVEATQDPLHKRLAKEYFARFLNEGWGKGTGISPTGDCQEHFGHDYHYGSYVMDTFAAVVADLKDPDFERARQGVVELYSYLYCPNAAACIWSARTAHNPSGTWRRHTEPKCEPGPDFTVDVRGGSEWFAARRKGYYALTYHGRLAPMWLNYYFASRLGYGGGALCQVTVPGKGAVIASTLNGSYGKDMERHKWPGLHLHSIVGTMADGRPLVTADSIHHDARLEGNVVESSGEVRDRPLRVRRRYTFGPEAIGCEVSLADTAFRQAYWNQGHPQTIAEAWEMIPFVGHERRGKVVAKVTAQDAEGNELGELGAEPAEAQSVIINRGGYGVKLELPAPMQVKRGKNDTVLIRLVGEEVKKAEDLSLTYRIVPFLRE